MSNRLLYVAGCPSSGSSAIAGILYHLGVDMGKVALAPGYRGYPAFEDTQANAFKDETGQLQVGAYADYRLGSAAHPHAGKHGLKGFKHTPLWINCDGDLPLDVIHIQRPLEDSIASDARYMEQIAARRPAEDWPRTPQGFRDRAGVVASAWLAAQQVAKTYPCLMALRFYDLLAEKTLYITSIAAALGLPTEGPRLRAAVGFVDAGKRHV